MPTADLYLRLSLDHERATSIDRQADECRRWCQVNGLDVRSVHVDRGVSGYRPQARREGFDAALAAITSGAVSTLVVWKLDRLSRPRHRAGRAGARRPGTLRRAARFSDGRLGHRDAARPDGRGHAV